MKLLIVGGTFDEYSGRASSIINTLDDMLMDVFDGETVNGGNLIDLDDAYTKIGKFGAVVWMPNVSNKEEKYLKYIKKHYPKVILISSKRIVEKNYTDHEVVGRLLDSRSAAGITIKSVDSRYVFELLDPIGNSWYKGGSVRALGLALMDRLEALAASVRVPSICVGPRNDNVIIEPRFLDSVRRLSRQFDSKTRAHYPQRFMGNAATRINHLFPGAKRNSPIYVTKRNVNKAEIESSQFVQVSYDHVHREVSYFGEEKPSVDSAIQWSLFQELPNVNYMVHGHVYCDGAPFTKEFATCGSLEEIDHVLSMTDEYDHNFVINLKGHGCTIFAKDIDYLDTHEFYPRPFLEQQ